MQIVDYRPEHADAWRALNEAWISQHFVLEDADRVVLGDPQAELLDKGGAIFIAIDQGEVVGCCGLKAMADGGFEVVKMTASEASRGLGVGRALMEACIQRARTLGAPRLYLETNSVLAPALGLYRRYGFVELPAQPTPYARADVFMELRL